MKTTFFFLIVLCATQLRGQGSLYTYYKKDTLQIISNGSSVFIYGENKKTKGAVERSVNVNERHYTLLLIKTKDGKVQQVIDSTGAVLATILLYGDERYNVVLSNGEKLLWKYNHYKWAYEKGGRDVIAGEFQINRTNGKFLLKDINPSNPLAEVIKLTFLDRSKYIVHAAQYDNVAAGLTVMRMLTLFR